MPVRTSAERVVYLDSSALVKLVVREAESGGLRTYLRHSTDRASCDLARVEVVRSVRPHGAAAVRRARQLLRRITLLRLDEPLLDEAAELDAPLRSLDAIHLAAARTFGGELKAVITYDTRMAAATTALGLRLEQPGSPSRRSR